MDPFKEIEEIGRQIQADMANIRHTCDSIDQTLLEIKQQDQPWTKCMFSPNECPIINFIFPPKLKCKYASTCANLRKSAAKRMEVSL